MANSLRVDCIIKMPPMLLGVCLESRRHMFLGFFAGIMPSLLLIKAVYCLGRGFLLGAILEIGIQFTEKFI